MKKVLLYLAIVATTFSLSSRVLAAANPGPIEELINNTLAEWEEIRVLWEDIDRLWDDTNAILDRILGLEDTTQEIIESMPGELKVYDGNGQYLGLHVSGDGSYAYSVFIESIGKVASFDNSGLLGGIIETFYLTTDCTGIPYASIYSADVTYRSQNDTIIRTSNNQYGYLKPNNGGSVPIQSVLGYDGECFEASPDPSRNYVEIEIIEYPYTDPVQTPYDVRYE